MKPALVIAVLVGLPWLVPSWAQDSPPTKSNGSSAVAPPDPAAATAPTTEWQGVKADVKATAETIARLTTGEREKWDRAVAALPSFCHEWEKLLHDREVENLAHLNWKDHE